jgi:hypothetical protein
MRRRPEDMTLDATAGGIMLATGAAIALVIYAMLTVLHLVSPSLVAEDLVRLVY